jgi:hypothetical protein
MHVDNVPKLPELDRILGTCMLFESGL